MMLMIALLLKVIVDLAIPLLGVAIYPEIYICIYIYPKEHI